MNDNYVAEVTEYEKINYSEFLYFINDLTINHKHRTLDSLIRAEVGADYLIRIAAAGRELFPDYYFRGRGFLGVTTNVFEAFRAEISDSNLYENFKNKNLKLEEVVYETVIAKFVDNCQEIYKENRNLLEKYESQGKTLKEAKECESEQDREK